MELLFRQIMVHRQGVMLRFLNPPHKLTGQTSFFGKLFHARK